MKKILAPAAAALFLSAGAAMSQTATTPADGTYTDTATTPAVVEEEDGMDWGWLGIIGLAGLLGLRKRKDEHVRTHPTNSGTVNR